MFQTIQKAMVYIIALVVLAGLVYGGFMLKRSFHYNWYYRDAVQEQIDAAVNPLKERIKVLEAKK